MEKKVLIFAYSRANFGDDLFIYILANKYKNVQFYIHIKEEKYANPFSNLKNVNILNENRDIRNVKIEEYDAFAYVGGSIFMESEYSWHEVKEFNFFINECKKQNKPFFYITCNFGPYQTQEYLELVRKNFLLCEGISVRDKNSYELFKDLPSVTYAPDLAFTYGLDQIKDQKKLRNIGISVINLEEREKLKEKTHIYEEYIARIAIKFAKRGYKVFLFSFCEFEGDEAAIDRIMKSLPQKYAKNVKTVLYKDDIEGFINQYSKMNKMVCTRFHSMILSIILKQKIYNLYYSKKQVNASNDFKLFEKMDDIKDLSYEKILEKDAFKKISEEKYNQLLEKSQGQVKKIEEWINT